MMTVRSIGPALVLIFEVDAPLRYEALFSSHGEMEVLLAERHTNPKWRSILEAFFGFYDAEKGDDGLSRAERHSDRLAFATPITTPRITD
jgi:hypothetical protein